MSDIPQEIWDRVVDFANEDGSDSLKSSSLVCHAWLPRARTHLFHDFTFPPLHDLPGSDDKGCNPDELHLIVDGINTSTITPFAMVVRRLRIWYPGYYPKTKILFSQLPFKNVTHIRVHEWFDSDTKPLHNLIAQQSQLEFLAFDHLYNLCGWLELYCTVVKHAKNLHTLSIPFIGRSMKGIGAPPQHLPRLHALRFSLQAESILRLISLKFFDTSSLDRLVISGRLMDLSRLGCLKDIVGQNSSASTITDLKLDLQIDLDPLEDEVFQYLECLVNLRHFTVLWDGRWEYCGYIGDIIKLSLPHFPNIHVLTIGFPSLHIWDIQTMKYFFFK
ncbi:hypothetical protein VKT23_015944 [Stygiomarasmius scandens]|uniref:F-box domain-containing protein n=1 Tax=Marasmiellus scandens TaxID=2682957 RepID=A0ABR1IVZ0_9AGAR